MLILRSLLLSLCLIIASPLYAEQKVELININTADAATLSAQLIGVGPAKAQAIIAYRESFGPFQSVDELVAVKGIGESLLNSNRDKIKLK